MDKSTFLHAIKQEPNCATCHFFRSDEPLLMPVLSPTNGSSLVVRGECRRFPPAVVRLRDETKHNSEAEYEYPPIKVRANEYRNESDGKSYHQVVGDLIDPDLPPWCGEYRETIPIDYFTADDNNE